MERIPRSNANEYCCKLKPQSKPLYIHDAFVKGFVFRVEPTGSKSWILRYHYMEGSEWKQRKTGLSPFRLGRNDATGLTVAAARVEAERIKNEVKHEGVDPIEDKRKRAVARLIQSSERVTVKELKSPTTASELSSESSLAEKCGRGDMIWIFPRKSWRSSPTCTITTSGELNAGNGISLLKTSWPWPRLSNALKKI